MFMLDFNELAVQTRQSDRQLISLRVVHFEG